jgi:hypothetical protein
MSNTARKSGNRLNNLRVRSENSIAAWDDGVLDKNCVFVRSSDIDRLIERVETAIERAGLHRLEHQFLDGGVLVRFRRRHEAETFRRIVFE